ncbi:MAG TPA: molybdate ABC transporter substrate-binding protein [Candidatus Tumulicola sp.]|nr:molybdate ABC transporter substrate-binding protein [Candidatus Tumulicola sp.]
MGFLASITLTVFAAASLHNAFTQIGQRFEAEHPGVSVRLSFDGSQILETQIANGAPADVFASADKRIMDKAVSAGLVEPPVNFAGNSLVAIMQFDIDIHSLRDLTHDGLKLAICAEQVPCGRYTRIVLQRMSADQRFWPNYAAQVMRNVVTQEQNVESVVTKINLGEADAGIVYATDVVMASGVHFRNFPIPDEDQDPVIYPMAIVKGSANAQLAREFVLFVTSPVGQSALEQLGFRKP